jgi:hypothetical protein
MKKLCTMMTNWFLMTKLNFDSFEQDILDSVENDEWLSKGNIQEGYVTVKC